MCYNYEIMCSDSILLIYTDYVIGSNEANYVTASFLTKTHFKDLGA